MFTGLVEEVGTIESVVESGSGCDLAVRASLVSSDAAIGDSIAINGCCLTVVSRSGDLLVFQAGSETLSRTNLGELREGGTVNLERSLQVGQRMGGHYVTGHVDATGTVEAIDQDGEWAKFWFGIAPVFSRQMATKGSIAVDGISLTLVDVEPGKFSVALIPHTLEVTILGKRRVGDRVNIETDLLAKYVETQLRSREPEGAN